MSSNNYAIFGPRFGLEGSFRVLRMKSLPSEGYYDEVEECGVSTNLADLRALVATAQSLQFVDFGNGLRGLYDERDGFHFCAVSECQKPGIQASELGLHSENLDEEDIF